MKKVVAFILSLIFVISSITIPASAKNDKINSYMKTSFDVNNVAVVKSLNDFLDGIENGTIKASTEEYHKKTFITDEIEIKQDGCLCFDYKSDNIDMVFCTDVSIVDVTTTKEYEIYKSHLSSTIRDLIPVTAGHKYSIRKSNWNGYQGTLYGYFGFIAPTSTYNVDSVTLNSNKTIKVVVGNILANDTEMFIDIADGSFEAKDVYLSVPKYSYTSIQEDGDSIVTLPESGTYTLDIKVKMGSTTCARQVLILDTTDYLKPTLSKLDAPISAISGTNVIVGYAEPSATVYVTYKNKKYSWKANRNGIYRIILDEDMKEGTPFKIWQSKGKLTSKKVKYRVTDNE